PVAAHDADRLARLHGEAHILEGPELTFRIAALRAREHRFDRPSPATTAAEADPEPRDLDRVVCVHHSSFRTCRSRRRNTHMPSASTTTLTTTLVVTAAVSHSSGKNAARYIVKMPASGLMRPRKWNPSGRSVTA